MPLQSGLYSAILQGRAFCSAGFQQQVFTHRKITDTIKYKSDIQSPFRRADILHQPKPKLHTWHQFKFGISIESVII